MQNKSKIIIKKTQYFFDSDQWDTSDSYPYQDASKYIFFVSDNGETGFGGYDLCVADLIKKQVYNLYTLNSKINSDRQELGPAWSANAKFPK